jgi:hypothetical protein
VRNVWSDAVGGYIPEDTPFPKERIYSQGGAPSMGQAFQGLLSDTAQGAEALFDRIIPTIYDSPEKIAEKMINLEGAQIGRATFGQMLKPRPSILPSGETAYHTAEQVPMRGAGHLGRLADDSELNRAAFSAEANWIDPRTGRDVLLEGFGVSSGTPSAYQGGFVGADNVMQFNPGQASPSIHPSFNREESDLVEAIAAIRGLVDAQEGSAVHATRGLLNSNPNMLGVDVSVTGGRPVTRDEFEKISRVADSHGFFAADRGNGTVSFMNNDYSKLGGARLKAGGGLLSQQMDPTMPLGKNLREFGDEFDAHRVDRESWYIDYSDAMKNQGKGQATRDMMSKLSKVRPAAENALGSPRVKQEILNKISRDEKWAKKTGDVTRDDIQNLRKLMNEPGSGKETYSRIMKALKDGAIALPAVMLMIDGMPGAQDDGLI